MQALTEPIRMMLTYEGVASVLQALAEPIHMMLAYEGVAKVLLMCCRRLLSLSA